MSKAIFVDTSRCTACRGCQAGCKEWKELPAVPTKQWGSHQNPPDLNPYNFKLVRFSEHLTDGKVAWYFFPDQCRHCLVPPCKDMANMVLDGAVAQDEATGAVLFTEKTKELSAEDFEVVREACPYNIPRRDEQTGRMVKCDMCIDRIQAGMQPMCVKSCAMGAMHFGDRDNILAMAKNRLSSVQKEFPKARILDADSLSVIYLVLDDPAMYHDTAVAKAPTPLNRAEFLAKLSRPLRTILG